MLLLTYLLNHRANFRSPSERQPSSICVPVQSQWRATASPLARSPSAPCCVAAPWLSAVAGPTTSPASVAHWSSPSLEPPVTCITPSNTKASQQCKLETRLRRQYTKRLHTRGLRVNVNHEFIQRRILSISATLSAFNNSQIVHL